MTIGTKHYAGRTDVKDAAQGLVSAVIATIGVVDSDGDYTLPGAFTSGQMLMISEWNHSSVTGPHPPIGEGVLRVDGNEAIVDAKLFMDIPRAAAMAKTLVAFGSRLEWSYGYRVLEEEPGRVDGKTVNMLKRLHAFEASPVWRGAGVGTRTLTAKDHEVLRAARAEVESYQGYLALQRSHLCLIHSGL